VKSAAFSPDWLDSRLASLLPEYPHVSLCVALSGGADSVALLTALVAGSRLGQKPRKKRRPDASPGVRAIHVHHGLHANADKWSGHCRRLAAQLGVSLSVVRVKVPRQRRASLEAAARDARYAAFAGSLKPGEVLLTAHHQDDQLETVLLQLLRGAGIPGLAAMPEVAPFESGVLVRPLLTRSRAELEEWVRANGFGWIDDDTNANEQFDRNYLRRTVLPLVRERWPGAAGAVSRTARHAAEAKRLLEALARADVERGSVGPGLSAQTLRTLDVDRRANALRFWIARRGFTVPDTRRLDEIAGPLLDARADANPCVQWNGTLVQRHADVLTLRADETAPLAVSDAANLADAVNWDWYGSPRLKLAAFGGVLEMHAEPNGPLDLATLPRQLTVRHRQGGEGLRPRTGSRTRKLKALLQEARIPPGERDRLPLVYAGDTLIAVADRWVDASVQAKPASGRRGRIRWRTAGVSEDKSG
jgi:tRNA(Ile)-lysidine synthase